MAMVAAAAARGGDEGGAARSAPAAMHPQKTTHPKSHENIIDVFIFPEKHEYRSNTTIILPPLAITAGGSRPIAP